MFDLATRAYNHNFKYDAIIRSLLDTDFYKILMAQFIWKHYPNTTVTFELRNRTKSVILKNCIDIEELVWQLDYVKNLKFNENELIWLAGNTFYGQKNIFCPDFINALRNLKLTDYKLEVIGDDIRLTFTGDWLSVTLWEIYALSIVNELRTRFSLTKLNKLELDILYARAKTKIWNDLTTISWLENLNVSDFGTRRRHSFLWQEWVINAAATVLGNKFSGTSNAYLAMKYGLDAKGTNAHELPMTIAALASNDEELKDAQYKVLRQWEETYKGNLLIALPDTFGTHQFLENAPDFLNNWSGFRPDSKNPLDAGYEFINWWKQRGIDYKDKLVLFSDGLNAENIVKIHKSFNGQFRVGFGWGTNLTNNFKDCSPRNDVDFKAISLVCKVSEVNGRSAVKMSDNFEKISGSEEEKNRYIRVFGTEGMTNIPLIV